jgi:predicted HTH domain antitoxin
MKAEWARQNTRCSPVPAWYTSAVTIELPDLDSLRLTPAEARLELAIGLYAGRRVTLGNGARIAGVSHTRFMREVGSRGIPVHYTAEDALHDIAMVDKLCAKS